MKFALVLFAAVAATSPAVAFAAPGDSDRPAADQAAPTWGGFYVGAQAAYHLGEEIDSSDCVGLCARDHEVRDPYLAVQAGYDARVGDTLIVGVMGWIGVTPVKSEAQLSPAVVVRGETDFAGFLGVRAGLDGGPWLPYAFVGYEYVTGTVTNEAAPIPEVKGKHGGLGLGAGVEYRVARNWSVDGRYMYSDLGDDEYNFGGGPASYGEQAHTFSLGVNFRF